MSDLGDGKLKYSPTAGMPSTYLCVVSDRVGGELGVGAAAPHTAALRHRAAQQSSGNATVANPHVSASFRGGVQKLWKIDRLVRWRRRNCVGRILR